MKRGRSALICFYMVLCFLGGVYGDDIFRKRLHHLEKGDRDESDIEVEVVYGKNLAARILSQFKLNEKKEVVEYLAKLGSGLTAHMGRSEINYYFAVVDEEEVNGYSTPGGYIFITKGALKLMENEAQLMGVLAHEMSHVNRLHIVNEIKLTGKDSSITSNLATLITGADQTFQIILGKLMDKGLSILFNKGLKKQDEFEADLDAVKTLVALGYDWRGYVRYLGVVGKSIEEDSSKGVHLSDTHPSIALRLGELKKKTEEPYFIKGDGTRNEKRFKEIFTHL